MTSSSEMLAAALEYAGRGWRVHPLHRPIFSDNGEGVRCSCGKADCDTQGKHPMLLGWDRLATADESQIREWWTAHPSANVGIACGPGSGLFLLDKDGPGADERIKAYVEKNGITTAEEDLTTATARTGKGEHLIFGWVDGIGLENFKNTVRISDDLDIKTDGGQFVAPPSLHPSGRRYEWIRPPWEVPPRPVPAWLADFLREEEARTMAKKRAEKLDKIATKAREQKAARLRDDGAGHPYGRAALGGEVAAVRAATPGVDRNDTLNTSAFKLFGLVKGGYLDKDEVERELSRAARSVGLEDSEIEKTLKSAWSGATAREIPDDDRGRGERSTEEARDLLEILEAKLSENPDGWAADPDVKRVLASYRRRDAVGAEALLKRAGVRGALKAALLTDLKRIDSDEGDDEKSGRGPSMATRIVDLALASGALFWKSPEGEPFATIPNGGGHIENHPLRSKAAKTWLSGLLYEAEGRAPKGSAVMDALAVLEGRATFEGETFPVFVRLAESGGKFYLDLGGEDWRAVEIDSGGWRVIPSEAVPVKFRRSKGFMELPEPTRGGELEDLRRVLNVPEGAPWVLVRAWLVQAFKPSGPYPVLIVDGEQGSGKSWLGRILRAAVDPNKSPLRRPPRNEHEMMISGSNSWLQNYDNLSGLPPWLGDAICVMSTGGGMSTRALYTDGEEALFDIQRPVILNGIDALTSRGDLLDRAILLHLPRIEDKDRMTEKEILAEVERIRPGVLGAILDVISSGLRELPTVRLESMPRMADFAEWVVACEQAPGWKPGEFLEAFAENQRESKVALIENDMFAVSLVKFINGPEEPAVFENTAGFLLSVLEERSGITSSNRPDGWPRTAKGAANKIRRLVPALRSVGIEVAFKTGHGHVRLIRIERHTATKKDVPPPIATKKTASRGDGGDRGGHSLTLTLNEKKREGERKEREEGEGKDRKSPPPSPPQPQHNGFCGGDGGDGGDRGAVVGESERTKTPPPKGDEEGRVFGLTHAYYRDLQRQTGGLSIKVLMDNQGWDRERADIAMGLLRKAGVVG